MLVRLLIKNYALIDCTDISFNKGLNMITGETGAGKSILMGALSLILGNRADGKQFYDDQKKCIIEGYFRIGNYNLSRFFDEHELEYEEETIIRREISVDGKSRAFVNDSPVTLSTLKLLGERLIDIHSQHATLQINTEEFQFFIVDTLAHNEPLLSGYRLALKELKQIEREIKEIKEQAKAAHAELDYNQFIFDELERYNIQSGEVNRLESEQQQLENAEEIKRGLMSSNYLIADGESNVLALLKDSIQQVLQASRYLGNAEEIAARLQSTYIEIKDVSEEINLQADAVLLDNNRLDEVNTRLSDLYNLLKKHRADSEEDLLTLKDSLETKLQMANNHDAIIEKLQEDYDRHFADTLAIAQHIHDRRIDIIPIIESSVQEILAHVGMGNAQLNINLVAHPNNKLNNKGLDNIEFLFSANKGQALQPIHKVASGGELSRVMLAIKSLVAKSSSLPTIIFDEIDTGISGEVALRVGEVMDDLAKNMQVIAITHLPQIASKGHAHFKVYKEDFGNKTRSNIALLDMKERVEEIAKMLSGSNPGVTAIKHARELLK